MSKTNSNKNTSFMDEEDYANNHATKDLIANSKGME